MLTTVAAGRVYDFSHCMGMYSTSGIGFLVPHDFAFGADDTLYVLNRGVDEVTMRISKCTLNHEFIADIGRFGMGDGQFVWPTSIELDRDENIYVTDDNLHRVTVLDKDGQFLTKWGAKGSGDGELNGPSGIAIGPDDNLYIVDSLNNRVQKFDKDGQYLGQWGSEGRGTGQFSKPWGICVDRQGDVYVADWKNDRVQKFTSDGRFLSQFSGISEGVGVLRRPTGVAVDSDGDVYVADWGNHEVKIYASDGKFIASLVGDAEQASPWAQDYIDANPDVAKARRRTNMESEWRFNRPIAVNVDAKDRLFVAEAVRHRIQIYNKETDYAEAALNL